MLFQNSLKDWIPGTDFENNKASSTLLAQGVMTKHEEADITVNV